VCYLISDVIVLLCLLDHCAGRNVTSLVYLPAMGLWEGSVSVVDGRRAGARLAN